MARLITVQTRVPAGETEWDFTVPAGHTCGFITYEGVTHSVSTQVRLRLGTGGTFDTGASDYVRVHNSTLINGVVSAQAFLQTYDNIFTGPYDFVGNLWGFNTSGARMIIETQMNTANNAGNHRRTIGYDINTGTRDQVRVLLFAGTGTGGLITLTTWKRTCVLFSHTFGGEAEADFTNLQKYSMLVGTGHALAPAGSSRPALRFGVSNTVFDAGATDYATFRSTTRTLTPEWSPLPTASAGTRAFAFILSGFNKATPTICRGMELSTGATGVQVCSGNRVTAQAERALRVACLTSTYTSGEAQVMAFKI